MPIVMTYLQLKCRNKRAQCESLLKPIAGFSGGLQVHRARCHGLMVIELVFVAVVSRDY
jgi:hypothetical protein